VSEFKDIINFPYRNKDIDNVYVCFREPPQLTVVIGAICPDGIVLIADKKISAVSGRTLRF
jgi:20S proteasome alpha/beta subunit